jgi:hypothetical protein
MFKEWFVVNKPVNNPQHIQPEYMVSPVHMLSSARVSRALRGLSEEQVSEVISLLKELETSYRTYEKWYVHRIMTLQKARKFPLPETFEEQISALTLATEALAHLKLLGANLESEAFRIVIDTYLLPYKPKDAEGVLWFGSTLIPENQGKRLTVLITAICNALKDEGEK